MTASTQDRPGAIDARPVRHPGRWVAVVVIAIVVAMIISSFVTNEKWNFPFAFEIMQQTPVIEGLWKGTIFGTVGAMVLGIGLGVILAVMRLSTNPVLRGRRVRLHVVLPRDPPLRPARAARHRHRLPLPRLRHRGAVRPADRGRPGARQRPHVLHPRLQQHLEHDLGRHPRPRASPRPPTWPRSPAPASCRSTRARPRPPRRSACRPGKTMRRVVLPQAMRVIVPADRQRDDRHGQGHLAARGGARSSSSCSTRRYQFGQRSFQIMPGIVAATIWYLIVCSILMVGQSRLERYYGRGFGARAAEDPAEAHRDRG